jgi:hypothetical protein
MYRLPLICNDARIREAMKFIVFDDTSTTRYSDPKIPAQVFFVPVLGMITDRHESLK